MKILLVEDDDMLRTAMQHLIPRWGHEVDTAEDGRRALDKVKKFQFDVVLLDEQLPDTRGRELASKLREHARNDTMLIVGLTGFVDADARQSFLDAGMDDVVQKPIRQENFESIAAKLIQKN